MNPLLASSVEFESHVVGAEWHMLLQGVELVEPSIEDFAAGNALAYSESRETVR
jgi:hypothetical protein